MATVAVTSESRDEAISEGVSILYFTADWCPPCQQFRPIYDEVSDEFPEITFGKVDVDAEPQLSADYGVRSIPTLVIHRDGKAISRHRGALSGREFRDVLEKAKA